MANLDQIMDYTADAFTVSNDTGAITKTSGTLDSSVIKQYGHVITISIVCHNTSAVSSGGNIFTGTLDSKYRPSESQVFGIGFNGGRPIGLLIANNGDITIRNLGDSLTANSSVRPSITYIID